MGGVVVLLNARWARIVNSPNFPQGRNPIDTKTIDKLDLPCMGTRWRIEFDARDPRAPDLEVWKVGIAQRKLDTLQKFGHAVRQARILLVREVLGDTREIFQGWSRPDTDGCFIYVGTPGHDYRGPTIEVPPPPGMVFLVFVLPDGTIEDWNWRPVKAEDPTMPEGINGSKLWPPT